MNTKNPFAYNQTPSDAQIVNMNLHRLHFSKLHDEILKHVPESRERSIALTKLEEASFWVNKAITHQGE